MQLRGLNFLKGREDPIAMPEEDYPEWLWRCLDTEKKKGDAEAESAGDEFCKPPLSIHPISFYNSTTNYT
jgi:large subunit ribosomal protein L54